MFKKSRLLDTLASKLAVLEGTQINQRLNSRLEKMRV